MTAGMLISRRRIVRGSQARAGGASGLMLLLCVKGGEVLVVAVCELG